MSQIELCKKWLFFPQGLVVSIVIAQRQFKENYFLLKWTEKINEFPETHNVSKSLETNLKLIPLKTFSLD